MLGCAWWGPTSLQHPWIAHPARARCRAWRGILVVGGSTSPFGILVLRLLWGLTSYSAAFGVCLASLFRMQPARGQARSPSHSSTWQKHPPAIACEHPPETCKDVPEGVARRKVTGELGCACLPLLSILSSSVFGKIIFAAFLMVLQDFCHATVLRNSRTCKM